LATLRNLSSFLRHLTREMAAETVRDLLDQQLVEKVLAEPDEAVFQAIVRRHGTMVIGKALSPVKGGLQKPTFRLILQAGL
jgi:hypothetical protein